MLRYLFSRIFGRHELPEIFQSTAEEWIYPISSLVLRGEIIPWIVQTAATFHSVALSMGHTQTVTINYSRVETRKDSYNIGSTKLGMQNMSERTRAQMMQSSWKRLRRVLKCGDRQIMKTEKHRCMKGAESLRLHSFLRGTNASVRRATRERVHDHKEIK